MKFILRNKKFGFNEVAVKRKDGIVNLENMTDMYVVLFDHGPKFAFDLDCVSGYKTYEDSVWSDNMKGHEVQHGVYCVEIFVSGRIEPVCYVSPIEDDVKEIVDKIEDFWKGIIVDKIEDFWKGIFVE